MQIRTGLRAGFTAETISEPLNILAPAAALVRPAAGAGAAGELPTLDALFHSAQVEGGVHRVDGQGQAVGVAEVDPGEQQHLHAVLQYRIRIRPERRTDALVIAPPNDATHHGHTLPGPVLGQLEVEVLLAGRQARDLSPHPEGAPAGGLQDLAVQGRGDGRQGKDLACGFGRGLAHGAPFEDRPPSSAHARMTVPAYFRGSTTTMGPTFTLSSSDLGGQATEDQVFNGFGCTGRNLSPALSWVHPPAGTKSFAVTLFDPDAPTGSGWWHWLVFDLPADVRGLPTGAGTLGMPGLPIGAVQSRTDYGIQGYGGPCPPPGHGLHR